MQEIPPNDSLFLGLKLSHLIAGAVGGLSRSLARPGGSVMRHVTTAIVGTAVAGYGTPIATALTTHYFAAAAVSPASAEGAVGFVLGLTGMSICEALLRWARIWRDGPPPNIPQ